MTKTLRAVDAGGCGTFGHYEGLWTLVQPPLYSRRVNAHSPIISPPELDTVAMEAGRLARLRSTMVDDGLDVCVLTNPVSIRYAIGYRGYASYQSRIPSAYAFVPVEGPVVVHGAYSDELPLIDVVRPSHAVTSFDAGLDLSHAAGRFVNDLELFLSEGGMGSDSSIGLERVTPTGHRAFADAGFNVSDAEPTVELARSRKSELEMEALHHTIAVAEYAMGEMDKALVPGITENGLWSILHQINIAHDGDWIDGRMLCSGPRTNPWYQESSPRVIEAGDLVAFDSDMIGPFGYCADISRTFLCGDQGPSVEQSALYERSREEVEHNTDLLRVGASFAELSQAVLRHPDEFIPNRYACAFHGVGMSDEYPRIPYPDDWEIAGYDGELEEGVVMAVESYVGAVGDIQGVKLEQMVQVTSEGVIPLSTHPMWERPSP